MQAVLATRCSDTDYSLLLRPHLAKDLTQGSVAGAGRGRRYEAAAPASLREPPFCRPKGSGEPDTHVGRRLLYAHPSFGEAERVRDATFARGTVPDRVQQLGTGMVRDEIPVIADLVNDFLVRSGDVSPPGPPVSSNRWGPVRASHGSGESRGSGGHPPGWGADQESGSGEPCQAAARSGTGGE